MPDLVAIGLMSGTSMDGVDAAILVTDGETVTGHGPRLFRPYREDERKVLRQALAEARSLDLKKDWDRNYVHSLDWLWLTEPLSEGPGESWIHPTVDLVTGETMTPLERLFAVADDAILTFCDCGTGRQKGRRCDCCSVSRTCSDVCREARASLWARMTRLHDDHG